MTTPIFDFVTQYLKTDPSRFHMPGHKGHPFLGCEERDITEIHGADVLYAPNGILNESEANASALFQTGHTFYSAEGSTLCIKAMLTLAISEKHSAKRPCILAARNAHKAFLYAAALLDFDIVWMFSETAEHLCSCALSAHDVEQALKQLSEPPAAVYVTSPDYLGQIADIAGIAKVCHANGCPLLVDNAHGAYLSFLSPSLHPIALGADMCCDSAHKTLPVLTGGAYLHLSKAALRTYGTEQPRQALSLFASTSPSYLILQSLDLCNRYMEDRYPKRLSERIRRIEQLKKHLSDIGYPPEQTEPLKLVLHAAKYGFSGTELGSALRTQNVECEYADAEYLVLMITPENTETDFLRVEAFFDSLPPPKSPNPVSKISFPKCKTVLTPRQAMLSPSEVLPVRDAVGRICACPSVSCPPAIPILVSGERIDRDAVLLLETYGIDSISVVK